MDSFPLGGFSVSRIGFGAMQLPGPGVFGPPRDRDAALAVLRRAIELGPDLGKTTSTPPSSTVPTSPTSSSARRCIHTRTTWPW